MAGSPCPIKTMNEVIEKMNMSEICITYGQTEASPATTMSKTSDSIETRVNTVGNLFSVLNVKSLTLKQMRIYRIMLTVNLLQEDIT